MEEKKSQTRAGSLPIRSSVRERHIACLRWPVKNNNNFLSLCLSAVCFESPVKKHKQKHLNECKVAAKWSSTHITVYNFLYKSKTF